MDNWPDPIVLTVGGIVATIVLGVISSALWEWVRDRISIISSNYIDIRGNWKAQISYELSDGTVHSYKEDLIIKQQFGRRFRGTLFSPHPENKNETIELDVRGEFKDKFHVMFFYNHRSAKLTDMGAGILQIDASHVSVEGASVNFGISSPTKPAIVKFSLTKSQ